MDSSPPLIRRRGAEADLVELRREWCDLLDHSAADSIFLTWDWMNAWWSSFGHANELYLIEARDGGGRLVALAPLRIRKRRFGGRIAEFLGQGGGVTPEYLDFIVRHGWLESVLPAMLRHLVEDETVAGFDLRCIPSDSPSLPIIRDTLEDLGPLWEGRQSQCPVIALPSTWQEYLAGKSRNYRKKLREYENRCRRELDLTFRRCDSAEGLRVDMLSLRRLHAARWGGKSRAFADQGYIRFHEDFAERLLAKGNLRLFVIEDRGRPVCVLHCFRHKNTVYYYQSGRDPAYSRYRVGLLVIHWAIRESIAEGIEVFDLLTGTEQYKQRWATGYADNLRIRFGSRGIIEKCVGALRGFFHRLSPA